MRTTLAFAVALLGGSASAQDWILQQGEAGWAIATACAPGGGDGVFTSACLSLGCPDGRPGPAAYLSVTEGRPGERIVASFEVDGRLAGALDFRADGEIGGWMAPLDEQDSLVAALRTGSSATLRLAWEDGALEGALGLAGSDTAIGEALAACPAPAEARLPADTIAQDMVPRESHDPAGEAIAANAEWCGDGVAGVDPEFLRRADVDGDGVNDAILDYLGLTCDGARAYCGSGGCSQEVWLGDPSGPYRLLVEGLIEAILLPTPGRVTLRLDGAACGRAGAEECERTFGVEDGRLVPQP